MKDKLIYRICRASIFSAIICVCSFINIPFANVPYSLTLLGVMLTAVVLSPFEAFCSTAVYVLIGVIGIPVFSGAGAGMGVLLGATGGYIWSYPIIAFIISLLRRINTKNKAKEYLLAFLGCIIGNLICYFFGTVQYMYVCDTSVYTAVITCIVPFIAVDIIKSQRISLAFLFRLINCTLQFLCIGEFQDKVLYNHLLLQ